MIHDIKEADLSLLQRFYDMANCADASYAIGLEWVEGKIVKKDLFGKEKVIEKDLDRNTLGYTYTDSTTGQTYLTTYARAIEANFNTNKIIKENCSPTLFALSSILFGISGYLLCKPTTLNNDIDNISKNSPASSLSLRTKEFVSNFEMLKHCPNTSNGFSATLFRDTRSDEFIFAIRGTEPLSNLMVDILFDIGLFSKEVPSLQYLDMLTFYEECLQAYPKMRESFVIVGHSLGGCLAQLLALSIATPSTCNNLKEIYTFNSPGAKELKSHFVITAENNERYSLVISNLGKVSEISSLCFNLIETLQSNLKERQPLKLSDSIFHLVSETGSFEIPNKEINNWLFHAIQNLWEDIDGKTYQIKSNVGFWSSHSIFTTIDALSQLLSCAKNNQEKNLISPNSSYSLSYISKPTQQSQEASIYLASHTQPKEPEKVYVADSAGFSHIEAQAIKQYKEDMEKYDKDLQEYEIHKKNLQEQNKIFKKEWSLFIKNEQENLDAYLSAISSLFSTLIPQLPPQTSYLNFRDSLSTGELYYQEIKDIDILNLEDANNEGKLGYFYCLYFCVPYLVFSKGGKTSLNSYLALKNLGYSNEFNQIFLSPSLLSSSYLEARKALYKSVASLKTSLQEQQIKENQRLSSMEYKEREREKKRLQREQEREYIQEKPQIFEGNWGKIIFLDTEQNLSNLIHIHSNKCDIFTKSGALLDIEDLQKQYALDFSSYQTQLFLYSTLLAGDSETSTPLYFGKVDSEGRFDSLSPTYVLNDLGEGKAHLKVFLDNQSLILYNYSLSENSLGVKLECKSEESKQMREKDKERVEREKAQKEALMITPSLLAFTPMIEDDTLMCSHGGSVKLQSQKGKKFKSKGVPLILESDLANSSISGCPNPPLSGGPCTKIALIPPLALSQKKFNGEGAPLQEYASMIMTDKGVPLMCIPKPNQFKVFQPPNPQGSGESAKEIIANIKLEKPKLRLHLKECPYQRDNLIVTRYVFEGKENILEEPLKQLEIRNLEEVKNEKIKAILSKDYENYSLKQSTLQIGMHLITMIFIIPTKIPKIFKDALENYKDKDYGVGSFKELTQYQQDFKKDNINHHYRTFIAPAKLTKIDLEFAVGLDDFLPYNSSSFIITAEELDDE